MKTCSYNRIFFVPVIFWVHHHWQRGARLMLLTSTHSVREIRRQILRPDIPPRTPGDTRSRQVSILKSLGISGFQEWLMTVRERPKETPCNLLLFASDPIRYPSRTAMGQSYCVRTPRTPPGHNRNRLTASS